MIKSFARNLHNPDFFPGVSNPSGCIEKSVSLNTSTSPEIDTERCIPSAIQNLSHVSASSCKQTCTNTTAHLSFNRIKCHDKDVWFFGQFYHQAQNDERLARNSSSSGFLLCTLGFESVMSVLKATKSFRSRLKEICAESLVSGSLAWCSLCCGDEFLLRVSMTHSDHVLFRSLLRIEALAT